MGWGKDSLIEQQRKLIITTIILIKKKYIAREYTVWSFSLPDTHCAPKQQLSFPGQLSHWSPEHDVM